MKNIRCITYELRMNRTQKRFLLHHIQELQNIYQDVCERLMFDTRYTKEDILSLLKMYHRYSMVQMSKVEVQDLICAVLHNHTYAKGKDIYPCLIGNKEFLFRGICLRPLLKYPLKENVRDVSFVRLQNRKGRLFLCLYIKKSYKNDGKVG